MHHIALLLPLASLLTAKVDRIAREALHDGPLAGLSIAVESKGRRVVSRGWGFANLELGVPATERTLYRIGSVTKQFTAAAILRLVETGRLRLDQDLGELLPGFPTQGHRVTVQHLLTHTSGIFSYTSLGPDFWEKTTRLELTPGEVLDLFKDRPFDFAPGEKWSYSNSGYHLLGMILEKIGGHPYAEVVRTEVLERAGLRRTLYCANEPILEGRAAGYSQKDGKLVNAAAIGMSIPFSAGGLCSTVDELIAWQRALETGKVVSAASYGR